MKKYLITFIYILTIFTAISTFATDNCNQFKNDCQYYTCINLQKNCGNKSYFKKFGDKYCNKFEKNRNLFSRDGQRWINQVKSCLIESIESLDKGLTCNNYKRSAISYHLPCYVDSGYCQLSKKDKQAVRKTIFYSLWRPRLIITALKVLSYCHKNNY